MIEGGIDVAFRFGALLDSNLTARPIASDYRVLCAAPAYLARAGHPAAPAQLRDHACIVYGARPAAHWLFQRAGKPIAQEVRAAFVVNDGSAALALALAGAGILMKSIWEVGAHLRAGRLVRVMTEFSAPAAPLHAVFPHGRQLAPRVRRFVDFSVARLRAIWPTVDLPADRRRARAA
jgi:DNA-binding transcriptional LysR family regulator